MRMAANHFFTFIIDDVSQVKLAVFFLYVRVKDAGVQHLLHLKSKSKILRPIEIMGFFYEFFCQIQGNNLL